MNTKRDEEGRLDTCKKLVFLAMLIAIASPALAQYTFVGTYLDANRDNVVRAADGSTDWWTTDSYTADDRWRERYGAWGMRDDATTLVPYGTQPMPSGGGIYQSIDSGQTGKDAAMLEIVMPGVQEGDHIFVVFWSDETGSPWAIKAGYDPNLEFFLDPLGTEGNLDPSAYIEWAHDSASRKMWVADLGEAPSTGDVWIYIDDLPTDNSNRRTWFDGVAAGQIAALQAIEPTPADGQTSVGLTPTLSWTPGELVQDVDGHDVYLGTDYNDVNDADTGTAGIYLGSTTDPNYSITTFLDGETVYYWRVDEVNDTNPNSPWKGDVWQFTTAPSKATDPDPADGETGASMVPLLSWTAGWGAADVNGHDVYLGTDFDEVNDADTSTTGVYTGRQTATSYQYPFETPLDALTQYYWRVDEINNTNTWKGDVWGFITGKSFPLIITKCTVKAGKTQAGDANLLQDATDINNIKDSFTASGRFLTYPSDLNTIDKIDVNIVSLKNDAGTLIYTETIDYNTIVGGVYSYSHRITTAEPNGAITSLKLNFNYKTFSIKTKNINLTGLGCPVRLDITLGDYELSGEASETVVNGSRKLIPTRLMRLFDDTIVVTKAKVKQVTTRPASDSLSVKGDIAVEHIDLDANEPNLVTKDVNVIWDTRTFTIPAESFTYKRGNKYQCKNIPVTGGLMNVKMDLNKCTFTVTSKYATLDDATGEVEFGVNFAIPDHNDFDEVVDVNLVTGKSE